MNISLATLEEMGACKGAREWFAKKFDFDDAAVYELFVWDVLAKDESVAKIDRWTWLLWWVMKRGNKGWAWFIKERWRLVDYKSVVAEWRAELLALIQSEGR